MSNELNIYRLSGFGDETESRARYWLAGSNDLTNSRAANFLLSKANMYMALLEVTREGEADNLNSLDLVIVSLRALRSAAMDDFRLLVAGSVIQEMIYGGEFVCDETDDTARAAHLDGLIATFDSMFAAEDMARYTGTFTRWWNDNVLENNWNGASEEEVRRYEELLASQGTGSLDPDDYNSLSAYVYDNGAYFVYFFLGDEKIRQYNSTIRSRYRKEQEVFNCIYSNCKGVYSKETVRDMLYAGCTRHYGMTPEAKIRQLESLGKDYLLGGGERVGLAIETILTIVELVILALGLLWGIFQQIFTYIVQKPVDSDLGVPDPDDWNIGEYKDKYGAGGSSSAMPLLIGGAAVLLLLTAGDGGKKKKRKK